MSLRRVLPLVLLLAPVAVRAQEEGASGPFPVPNPMGQHTPFIILGIGALLAWAISYTLELQREAVSRRKGKPESLQTKERILDRLAELEEGRESGAVPEARYNKQRRELRQQLSKVLEQLGGRKED